MNHTKERYWELIAAEVHNEICDAERSELDKLSNQSARQRDIAKIQQIREDLTNFDTANQIDKKNQWDTLSKRLQNRKNIVRIKKIVVYAAIFIFALLIDNIISLTTTNIKGSTTIKSPVGQTSEVILPDGSHVWLYSGSELSYHNWYDNDKRNIKLIGEAFFKVSRNEKVPFLIRLDQTLIKVLGTSFHVEAYPSEDEINIALVTGKITVTTESSNKKHIVKPSQKLSIDKLNQKTTLNYIDPMYYTNLVEGKFVINDQPLSEIVNRLEHWYNVEIKFSSPDVEQIRITGTILKNKPLDQMLKVLKRLYGFKYELSINNDKPSEVFIYK